MTRVKICGITDSADARAAVAAGADALGFVFAPSPRRITASRARRIARELPPEVWKVGVFVDAAAGEVDAVAHEVDLDAVQLHGDESPGVCAAVSRPVWKRLAVHDDDSVESLRARLLGYAVSAILLDPGAGSGRTFPWKLAAPLHGLVIVAGGLTAKNVASAIRAAKPYAVDVSSGVEDAPGNKSAAMMRAFVDQVRKEDARRTA